MASLTLCCAGIGCAASHDVEPTDTGTRALPAELSASCQAQIDAASDMLPDDLECTGLYSDFEHQIYASNVRGFSPAHWLWSDALWKERFIYLPPGTTIDASKPNAWVFPVGTKVWKEFKTQDHMRHIETRLFEKVSDTEWKKTTYEWSADEKTARRVQPIGAGKDIVVDGQNWHLPSGQECDECHAGRTDRLLGFEQTSLGLTGASGFTLPVLVAEHRIENLQGDTHLEVGDDGTGKAANALMWMHINCGVSCHNSNPNSKAYSRGMRLELDPTQLDGRAVNGFDSLTTTINVDTTSNKWPGHKRIVPGSTDNSWLYTLMTTRDNPDQTMPPLGTFVLDPNGTEYVKEWIDALGNASTDQTTTAPN